jgi:hypothetical protein
MWQPAFFLLAKHRQTAMEESALQNPLNEKKGKKILNRHISSRSKA